MTEENNKNLPAVQKVVSSDLLPAGFELVVSQKQAGQEFQELMRDRQETYSQSIDRAKKMKRRSFPEVRDRIETSLELHHLGRELMPGGEIDALEEYRVQAGLVERREDLLKGLFDSLSFEEGMRLFNLEAKNGKRYRTMEDLNRDFPNITRTELILFSLLSRAPHFFREYGSAHPAEGKAMLPIIAGGSISGVSFITEDVNPDYLSATDAYGHLGITAAPSEGREIIPFKKKVHDDLIELVSLVVTNQKLHERVWNRFDSALSDGFGRIDRFVLSKITGNKEDKRLVAKIIAGLKAPEHTRFEAERAEADKKIGRNIVLDMNTGRLLESDEVVKLIGFLNDFPQELLSGEPFHGFFAPYGPGVLLIDKSGRRNYYPYNPYYIREALQGLYYEAKDETNTNRTLPMLFNQLAQRAEEMAFSQVQETGSSPSRLEGVKIDMDLELGIDIEINPRVVLEERKDFVMVGSGEKVAKTVTVKFGAEEAEQIYRTLKILPKELLSNVKRIRKATSESLPLQFFLDGQVELGNWSKGTITLIQHPKNMYVEMTPEDKAGRSHTIIHEVFHSVWEDISPEDKIAWEDISWKDGEIVEPGLFLTAYSKSDPDEDFAEHAACYVLHGQEFRARAEKDMGFRRKYDFIKQALSKILGYELQFPQISPWTIEELKGYADREIKRRDLQEALDLQRMAEEEEAFITRRARAQVETRLDKGKVDDVLPQDKQEPSLPEYLSDRERITEEAKISFRRNSLNTFVDHFASNASERDAFNAANEVYELLEDGDYNKAIVLARRFIDEDDTEEFREELETIIKTIESGNYPLR